MTPRELSEWQDKRTDLMDEIEKLHANLFKSEPVKDYEIIKETLRLLEIKVVEYEEHHYLLHSTLIINA